MRVAIDIQTMLGQPTGFGFYVSNLVRALQKKSGSDLELVLIKPGNENDFSTPQRFIWDQFTFPRKAREQKIDLIHQPCFSVPLFYKGPVVVTIHDIISILFPQTIKFASWIFYSKWRPFSYRKAKRIITISESTKKDIIRVLNIPEEKIRVIPLSYDERYLSKINANGINKIKKKYSLTDNYILHVGTLEPRKNLEFLIDVFSQVIKIINDQTLSLVIAGKKGWYYEGLFSLVKKLGLDKRIIFTGYISEQDKAAIYQGAKLFVFPSIYEGFGLPPLEAMASGVPVISSNTSSMGEVVGEAGILISPYNKTKWIKELSRTLQDEKLMEEMKQKNLQQIKKFSWDKTAKATIDVYKEAINDK